MQKVIAQAGRMSTGMLPCQLVERIAVEGESHDQVSIGSLGRCRNRGSEIKRRQQ
jgi:hypothetical protein